MAAAAEMATVGQASSGSLGLGDDEDDGDKNNNNVAQPDDAAVLADAKAQANDPTSSPKPTAAKTSGGSKKGVTKSTTGSDGWRYAVDFSSSALQNATTKRKALHFVRRRRLVRHKIFDPSQFLPDEIRLNCDHCDSDAIRDISDKLLEVLSIATLLQTDADHTLTDAVAIRLKGKLMDELNIGGTLPPYLARVDPPTRVRTLCTELDKFPDKTTSILSMSGYTNMFNRTEVIRDGLSDRMGEISARYMSREERDELARLMIRHVDTPDFVLHCNKPKCGEACEYSPTPCPNVGCDECQSRKHMDRHDMMCGYKIVDCTNKCGQRIARNRLKIHLAQSCELRDASCPFRSMGCSAVVLAKDCPQHLADGAGGHLLLVAAQMEEYGEQIGDMQARMSKLEFENSRLRQEMLQKDADRKREVDALQKELNKVQKEASVAHKEAGKLNKSVRQLQNMRAHVK